MLTIGKTALDTCLRPLRGYAPRGYRLFCLHGARGLGL